jgi:hypothetical protein
MMRMNDAEVIGGLTSLIEIAKANGETAADVDPEFAARLMFNYVGGLFRRRALDERFDVEDEARMTMALVRALFSGAVKASNPTETP